MGAAEELKALLGDDLGQAERDRSRTHWVPLCRCGHLQTVHGPGISGSYPVPEARDFTAGGKPVREIRTVPGCIGAMPDRNFEQWSDSFETVDGVLVNTKTVHPTCPCTEFREVAQVDRPSRYFNQRIPTDLTDAEHHPLVVGQRAYLRRIRKLKRAQVSETGAAWADAEFDRRFVWGDGRRCDISRCTETDGVWPVFADDGHTMLRCAKHRDR